MEFSTMDDMENKPREYCGVFGIYSDDSEVARSIVFALCALQHRGQESAGICTSDGRRHYTEKGMGLVNQIFNDHNIIKLKGHMGIGHTRYSTTGGSEIVNAQPFTLESAHGPLAMAHNGNLTTAKSLRESTLQRGVGLFSSTDSEIIAQILCAPPASGEENGKPDWVARIQQFMSLAEGAYSLVIMTREGVFGVRDALGMRPLCVGEITLPGSNTVSHVISSESCALQTLGAKYLREVEPGEIVRIDSSGLSSFFGRTCVKRALCIFEYVYFARPDTRMEEQLIQPVRKRLGAQLGKESPVAADLVISVPDSGTPAAIGFAEACGIPFGEGLTKNRYIARTFIQPDQNSRRIGIRLKFNPLVDVLKDQRVVMVDDSIVRGNTMRQLVAMLKEAGAKEVHVRISSPPVRHPCFMGIDMATHEELVIHQQEDSIQKVAEYIGADSLAYLSHDGMMLAISSGRTVRPQSPGRRISYDEAPKSDEGKMAAQLGYCSACFTGDYPVAIEF